MMLATIFDIQRYSLHDGPGIRTTVFFKGCPLQCDWCCNPESQQPAIELGFHQAKCIACGSCVEACPLGAISLEKEGLRIDRAICAGCSDKPCARACPSRALAVYGRRISADDLMREVQKDGEFFRQSGGGVTASGGEPLMQAGYLADFFARCKAAGLDTAIETSSSVTWAAMESLIPHTDLFLCDLKHTDAGLFRAHTGGDLSLVLSNLDSLSARTDRVIIRVPLIPGFNDDADSAAAIFATARGLGFTEIHLLPFHRLGTQKYASLGRKYRLSEGQPQPRETTEYLARLAGQYGLQVRVGG